MCICDLPLFLSINSVRWSTRAFLSKVGYFSIPQLQNQKLKLLKLPKAPPSKTGNSTSRPGRPREFDHDVVLDKLMETFWAHGYDATSVSLLESKTGLAAPSLYAAFGNKQQLFQKSVERYREFTKPIHDNARKQPRSWLVAKHLLEGLVEFFTTVRVAQRVCAN